MSPLRSTGGARVTRWADEEPLCRRRALLTSSSSHCLLKARSCCVQLWKPFAFSPPRSASVASDVLLSSCPRGHRVRRHDAGQSTQALLAAHTERYRARLAGDFGRPQHAPRTGIIGHHHSRRSPHDLHARRSRMRDARRAPRCLGTCRVLFVLMLGTVRSMDCGATVRVGPAADVYVARDSSASDHPFETSVPPL